MKSALKAISNGFELYIEADAELAESSDWAVAMGLLPAMVRHAGEMHIDGAVSPLLIENLEAIQGILRSWIPGAEKVRIVAEPHVSEPPAERGASLFFSGGIDSFYSLLKNTDAIDNLILVHGFDIPLGNESFFEETRSAAERIASVFGKRLITVRSNIQQWRECYLWDIHHGPALAAVAHALAPNHSTVFIGSSYPYRDLHIWGSHPMLDPLWSSEVVRILHDGADANRIEKMRLMAQHPDLLKYIRVCWQNTGEYNCGRCEKCIRTMIAFSALGVLDQCRFASPLDPAAVRRVRLDANSALFWRELLDLDLDGNLQRGVRRALSNYEWKLAPAGPQRVSSAVKQVARLTRALFA